MTIVNNKEETKRIFNKLTKEDILRIISVLYENEINNPQIELLESASSTHPAKYHIQFYNERLRSVTIEVDSNLVISYRGERGEHDAAGNSYFGYKELFAIIAEKNL